MRTELNESWMSEAILRDPRNAAFWKNTQHDVTEKNENTVTICDVSHTISVTNRHLKLFYATHVMQLLGKRPRIQYNF
jgi:hypothetical protein